MVAKLQRKDSNFNNEFLEFFSENKGSQEKRNEDKKNMFRIIQNLKTRLEMAENPAVGCGWTNDLQDVLKKEN